MMAWTWNNLILNQSEIENCWSCQRYSWVLVDSKSTWTPTYGEDNSLQLYSNPLMWQKKKKLGNKVYICNLFCKLLLSFRQFNLLLPTFELKKEKRRNELKSNNTSLSVHVQIQREGLRCSLYLLFYIRMFSQTTNCNFRRNNFELIINMYLFADLAEGEDPCSEFTR